MQPKLHYRDAIAHEHFLKFDDLVRAASRRFIVDAAFDTLDEQPSVPGAIKDRHLAFAGYVFLETPKKVVTELFGARRSNWTYAHVAGVETGGEATNCATFSGGVETLKEYEQTGTRHVVLEQSSAKEP
jgi:hypothetical protein